jgi:hypothetical protein
MIEYSPKEDKTIRFIVDPTRVKQEAAERHPIFDVIVYMTTLIYVNGALKGS